MSIINTDDKLKRLVFRERDSLDEALELSLCRDFYNRLEKEQGEAKAAYQTLRLYNDALWVACKEIIHLDRVQIGNYEGVEPPSHYYDWQNVLDLAHEIPHKIPSNGPTPNGKKSERELFAVSYLPYGQWGETDYTPYDVTGYLHMPLVELLYDATNDVEDKLKLLEEIRDDVKSYYASGEDLMYEEPWVWSCAKTHILMEEKMRKSSDPILEYIEKNSSKPNKIKRKYRDIESKLKEIKDVEYLDDGTFRLVRWRYKDLAYFIMCLCDHLGLTKGYDYPSNIFRKKFRNSKGQLFSELSEATIRKYISKVEKDHKERNMDEEPVFLIIDEMFS